MSRFFVDVSKYSLKNGPSYTELYILTTHMGPSRPAPVVQLALGGLIVLPLLVILTPVV